MSKVESYVNSVMSYIMVDKAMKERIKSDLFQHLNELSADDNIDDVIDKMGNPEDVAKEFMDTLYEDKSDMIERLVLERTKANIARNEFYEYKSKTELFGLPLVHVKISKYGNKPCVAKGIIAIGAISIGVVSIGAIPVGIISIGATAIGIVSLGALAIGLLSAIGAVAIGSLAIGAIAIGFGAIGACAIGNIAIGEYARGIVAIGSEAIGKYSMQTEHVGPEAKEAVQQLIKTAYPNLPDWIVNIFTSVRN
ncbi:interferon alpha-inducible IFI6/IFI27 family protein [Acetivibrio cellulolyticus]|uniref:interferon alpha-inducible IFI6/IFI27 family protein n=1 Tax=Acetivibrio cellulolyticus TaxID=35830 RepID=UPI0001E2C73C|nr:interferon alpha-inducible IFI6/IFI27 family protein [Acetivibrio cellulolyticus]